MYCPMFHTVLVADQLTSDYLFYMVLFWIINFLRNVWGKLYLFPFVTVIKLVNQHVNHSLELI